jgi:hypothetical protein
MMKDMSTGWIRRPRDTIPQLKGIETNGASGSVNTPYARGVVTAAAAAVAAVVVVVVVIVLGNSMVMTAMTRTFNVASRGG